MHEAEVPGEGIADGILHTVPSATDLLINTTVGNKDTVLGHLTFLLTKKLSVVGPRWKDEEGDNSNDDRDDTFDEEEPLPSVHTSNTIHVLENTSSQETRDDVGDCVTSVPDSHSEGTLLFGVPGGSHERQTGEERSLHQADEEPDNTEANTVGHSRHADSSSTPHKHDSGEENLGVCLGHDEVTRELTDEIADVECRDTSIPDCIGHAEIFLQAGKTSVGNVNAVEVAEQSLLVINFCMAESIQNLLHEEHKGNTRHHVPIDLLEDALVQLTHLRLREISQKRKASLNLGGRNMTLRVHSILDTLGELGLFVADVIVAVVLVYGSRSHGGDATGYR